MAIADQLAELNTLRENLATAINGNGVDASITEGLSGLVPKAGQVAGMYKDTIDRSIKKVYSLDVETVGDSAFCNCASLTDANFQVATYIDDYAFDRCTALSNVNFPAVTNISSYAFDGCTALTELTDANFPAVTEIHYRTFKSCQALKSVDLSALTYIGTETFLDCCVLDALILRRSKICELSNTNSLSGTPVASGTGYIYVPAALVDSYKSATNWTVYANQIRAIEDYPEICGGAV